jgi:hypothetical protein
MVFPRKIYLKILVSMSNIFGSLIFSSTTCLVDYSIVILVGKVILFLANCQVFGKGISTWYHRIPRVVTE